MKLMAETSKSSNRRWELQHDLRRCRAQWEISGTWKPFPLGERDLPDRLIIPERLYGREPEVEALRAAFDRIVAGAGPELLLVAAAGVGKSAMVQEFLPALTASRGLFTSAAPDPIPTWYPLRSWRKP